MQPAKSLLKRFLSAALLFCAGAFYCAVSGQTAPTQPQQQQPTPVPAPTETPSEEVLRISTELVQTDVMVFDKEGRFIDNLKPEQFELRVDGKPQPVSFFERVVAGTLDEEALMAAARGVARTGATTANTSVRPLDRGRAIFFFIDDLHLSAESIIRTRKTLLSFIDKEMGQNDQVAITSSSGQVGFLQQLTDNKDVLRKAVERLSFRGVTVRDTENPPMTVYQALQIEQNNSTVAGYFEEALLREMGMRPEMAQNIVRARARQLVQQSDHINNNVLLTLASLMRSTAQLPGRKLVFFISDGFAMNTHDSDVLDKMRRATDAAARSGTVIYTLDARGLQTGMDASVSSFDTFNRLPSSSSEIRAAQEPLRSLAADTGGRALLNTNALDASIEKGLQETSVYYLLAWRPDDEQQKPGRFRRIEARVIGRPDLTVRVRSGFFSADPETVVKRGKSPAQASPARATRTGLGAALADVFPRRALPTSLLTSYTDMPGYGPLLTISMAVAPEAITLEMKDAKHTGAVEVGGIVLNEEGKAGADFKDQLQLNIPPSELRRVMSRSIAYNYQVRVKPGLYQVRVAAHDMKSGRTGSAMQWIEIPDLSRRQLTLSSLLVGSRASDEQDTPVDPNASLVNLSVERRFQRSARLRFLTYIYNAALRSGAGSQPDVAIQIQVMRDDQPVITTVLRKVSTEGLADLARIPYAAEVLLNTLPVGQYVLHVTAIDRFAKTSASQQINFEIK
ncbi:MAG TPA: VWA domain-containing protein [Pyrinomonadaceae bacterium]|jgi:VWFA-related protein|nr:VWA domain-containing protein [Pyrinomonadaceae bacterium]